MNSLKRQEPVVGPSVDNDQQLEIPRAHIDANLAGEELSEKLGENPTRKPAEISLSANVGQLEVQTSQNEMNELAEKSGDHNGNQDPVEEKNPPCKPAESSLSVDVGQLEVQTPQKGRNNPVEKSSLESGPSYKPFELADTSERKSVGELAKTSKVDSSEEPRPVKWGNQSRKRGMSTVSLLSDSEEEEARAMFSSSTHRRRISDLRHADVKGVLSRIRANQIDDSSSLFRTEYTACEIRSSLKEIKTRIEGLDQKLKNVTELLLSSTEEASSDEQEVPKPSREIE